LVQSTSAMPAVPEIDNRKETVLSILKDVMDAALSNVETNGLFRFKRMFEEGSPEVRSL